MSLRTRTWDQLVDTVSAYAGVTVSANPKDLTRVQTLANQAAREVHEFYPWLDRWLVVAEPRTVSRGQVESTEDSFYVYGAGTDAVNGLYVRNGSTDSKPAYTLYDSDGTTELYNLFSHGSGVWLLTTNSIGSSPDANSLYTITSDSDTVPTSGWSVGGAGTSPAPLLVDVAEIYLMLHMDRYNIYQDRVSQPLEFHTFAGNYIIQARDIPKTAYCTYQKPLTEEYGNGTGGTTSSIPEELFSYMALYAARQMQIVSRQSNSNQLYAAVTAKQVQDAFESIGMRQEYQGTIENVAKRITTHFTTNTNLV